MKGKEVEQTANTHQGRVSGHGNQRSWKKQKKRKRIPKKVLQGLVRRSDAAAEEDDVPITVPFPASTSLRYPGCQQNAFTEEDYGDSTLPRHNASRLAPQIKAGKSSQVWRLNRLSSRNAFARVKCYHCGLFTSEIPKETDRQNSSSTELEVLYEKPSKADGKPSPHNRTKPPAVRKRKRKFVARSPSLSTCDDVGHSIPPQYAHYHSRRDCVFGTLSVEDTQLSNTDPSPWLSGHGQEDSTNSLSNSSNESTPRLYPRSAAAPDEPLHSSKRWSSLLATSVDCIQPDAAVQNNGVQHESTEVSESVPTSSDFNFGSEKEPTPYTFRLPHRPQSRFELHSNSCSTSENDCPRDSKVSSDFDVLECSEISKATGTQHLQLGRESACTECHIIDRFVRSLRSPSQERHVDLHIESKSVLSLTAAEKYEGQLPAIFGQSLYVRKLLEALSAIKKFVVQLTGTSMSSLNVFGASIDPQNLRRKVVVNGVPIRDDRVRMAEQEAGPIHPGNYWYDVRAGFWGVAGGPCIGIIPPFIEEFDYPMARTCAGGSTGIVVNERELHRLDLKKLMTRGFPDIPGRAYSVDIDGRLVHLTSGTELQSLAHLAPSLEIYGRGSGMYSIPIEQVRQITEPDVLHSWCLQVLNEF